MKRYKHIFLLLTLLLVGACFLGATAPGSDTSSDSFGVQLINTFSSEDMDPSVDCPEIHYTLQSIDTGLYAQAAYDESIRCYTVMHWAVQEEDATVFTAGMDANDPGRLAIIGLAPGSYAINNIQVPAGVALLHEPIAIEFLANTAHDGTITYIGTVNGTEISFVTEDDLSANLLPFAVTFSPGFDLPDVCGGCRYKVILRVLGLVVLILAAYLTFLLIKGRKKLEDQSNK